MLKNDNTKLAGLITLLKTVLEKAAQKTSLPPPHTTKSQQKLKKRSSTSSPAVPKTLTPPLTKKDLLSVGLMHAGFDLIRQQNVKHQTNIDRFKAFYGLEPTTLVPVFTDVKDRFPEATFHHLLLTMNWLTHSTINIWFSVEDGDITLIQLALWFGDMHECSCKHCRSRERERKSR